MAIKKKNIALAEHSYLLRKGLALAVSQLSNVENIIELDTQTSLVSQIEAEEVDIIIINPQLLGVTPEIKPHKALKIDEDIPVVALVYSLIDEKYLQNFAAVLTITDSLETIAGKLQKVIGEMDRQENEQTGELSDREKEILVALVRGMINKEIADYFNLSVHTVIAHRRNITRKLGIHSVSGLTVYAILNKLVDLQDLKIV